MVTGVTTPGAHHPQDAPAVIAGKQYMIECSAVIGDLVREERLEPIDPSPHNVAEARILEGIHPDVLIAVRSGTCGSVSWTAAKGPSNDFRAFLAAVCRAYVRNPELDEQCSQPTGTLGK